MTSKSVNIHDEELKYSRLFSSLFCSVSIIFLSILCLLNNLSFDIYSACSLLKTVIPASICFWFLGFSIGSILDKKEEAGVMAAKEKEAQELTSDNGAYEIPSMFSDDAPVVVEDEFGDL